MLYQIPAFFHEVFSSCVLPSCLLLTSHPVISPYPQPVLDAIFAFVLFFPALATGIILRSLLCRQKQF